MKFTMQGAFVIIVIGAGLNALAWLVESIGQLVDDEVSISSWGSEILLFKLPGGLVAGTVLSLALSAGMASGTGRRNDAALQDEKVRMQLYAELAKSNGIEHLLYDSMRDRLLVLITLKSRKVYVGKVQDQRLLHGDLENIVIIPMLSGFRDKDTLRFAVQHSYYDYYRQQGISDKDSEGSLNLSHFRTVVPASEIDSISLFDLHTYQEFSELEKARSSEIA
jgi:hypothetical protein